MRQIRIYLTEKCNASCPWCLNKNSRNPNSDMDTEKCKKLIDYCVDNHIKSLCIFGGEPTIHPDFLEIWNYAYDKFDSIILFTNGLRKDILSKIQTCENKGFNINFNHLDKVEKSWIENSPLVTEVVITKTTKADAIIKKMEKIYQEVKEIGGEVYFNITLDCTLNIFKYKDDILPIFDEILNWAIEHPYYHFGVDHKYPKCCIPNYIVEKINNICKRDTKDSKDLFLCNPLNRKTPLITSDFRIRTCPQYDGNYLNLFHEDGSIISYAQLSNFIAFEILNRWKSLKNTSCAECEYFMSECNGGCFSNKFKH